MSKEKPQLYRVYLKARSFLGNVNFDAGRHSEEKILEIFKLFAGRKIPTNNCISQISGTLSNGYIAQCCTTPEDNYFFKTDINNFATITCDFYTNCKCKKSQCFQNIKSGKCTNEYMRETIGAHLFADSNTKKR